MNNKENRKLSTILAMDVVGYSSKMADDDEGTLKLLAERRLIIEKHTKSHGGRIFNTASHHLGKKENAQKYFDRVKELLGGENTLDALKKEAAIWHEMTVIEEMMPVYLEYGLK